MPSNTQFPDDFAWGTATSAYQIEGAVAEDGRAPSIWDTFSRTPGKVANGETGDVACDHYHRWESDFDLLSELGVNAYRLSIAWPRIIPDGNGEVNQQGLDFYSRLIDNLLERGIEPYVTLYHWDLPQALQDLGGWQNRSTAEHFARYSGVVAGALGDRVRQWTTLNEPYCSTWLGHLDGVMAPGIRDIGAAVSAGVHLHLGHGLAVQAIRAVADRPQVGIVNNLMPVFAASDDDADQQAAARVDGHSNRWWLDPIHGRGYPEDMQRVYGVDLPLQDGDLETIAAPLDYLGVNYYTREVVRADPAGGILGATAVPTPGAERTAMDWEVYPDGLRQILERVHHEYRPSRILVTENGAAYDDKPTDDGTVDDDARVAYLADHLAAVSQARANGVPIQGYFAWSLLDNFEWAFGYDKRFGLVYVDFQTQQRTIKSSGRAYAAYIAAHRPALRALTGRS